MQIHLITVGHKMPAWVTEGFDAYAKRLPHECRLKLVELAPVTRGKNANKSDAMEKEAKSILDALPKDCLVVALDERGKHWSTRDLSTRLDDWLHEGRDVALLIGGADGLSQSVRDRADRLWALSSLTLPHGMVRIVVAEQLYRAWSILKNHPYHRD